MDKKLVTKSIQKKKEDGFARRKVKMGPGGQIRSSNKVKPGVSPHFNNAYPLSEKKMLKLCGLYEGIYQSNFFWFFSIQFIMGFSFHDMFPCFFPAGFS